MANERYIDAHMSSYPIVGCSNIPFVSDFEEQEKKSSTVSLTSQSGRVFSNYCSNVSLDSAFDELGKRSFTVSLTSQSGTLCSS